MYWLKILNLTLTLSLILTLSIILLRIKILFNQTRFLYTVLGINNVVVPLISLITIPEYPPFSINAFEC